MKANVKTKQQQLYNKYSNQGSGAGGGGGGSKGSRLEAWMKSHKSEVAVTFTAHQPGNSVCVAKDTSKQNI